MPVNRIMLELAEEMVNPDEAVLDDQIEDTIDTENDVLLGISDNDDAVIEFIAKGNRIANSDPVDFTDDDVDYIVQDDETE